MTRFVVMDPPSRRPAGETVFVRDRFSWLALLFPFVWLLWNRLWLATIGFVSASAALAFAFRASGSGYTQFAILALCALVALEGPAWRLAKLRRLGYTEAAILNADSLDDAERIYADGAANEAPTRSMALTPAGRQAARAVRTLLDPIGG
ncbi:DUF2628 domain-containing protein [Aureimonas altamirensis]|uniref:DUF2628 domain-containing protein n=1 Tax=Aureimonas altamirensis TaxID=370622 RepID=UPI003017A8AF